MQQETIRARLVQRIGNARDAHAFAEASAEVWRRIDLELVPVIGTRGVEVLFSRALYLTSARFPWLAMAGNSQDGALQLAWFKAAVERAEAVAAAEASCAVLATFTELLSALIGVALTERLLDPVWALLPPAPTLENENS